jgi:cytochrome c551/c552
VKRAHLATAALGAVLCAANGAAIAPLAAQEPEPARTLAAGPNAGLTSARCGLCHDITHVTRTRLSRGEWSDNVKNMIERGAPIAPDEVPLIVEYLAVYYNRDTPPPAGDAAPAAAGDPVQQLLAANACTACHAVDRRVVGPSFREIAARYKDDAGARGRLAAKIKAGGSGVWGAVPMPPHAQLDPAALEALAGWVLSQ